MVIADTLFRAPVSQANEKDHEICLSLRKDKKASDATKKRMQYVSNYTVKITMLS